MGELRDVEDDPEGQAVLKIAQQANILLEARRKKENAKKMAKLMRNFNYDLLRGLEEDEETVETPPELSDELDLDEMEAERLRKLQEMEEELAAGVLLTQEKTGGLPKYEAPLIVQLRSVETVNELYELADIIIPPATLTKR